jgi:hypothetical protein
MKTFKEWSDQRTAQSDPSQTLYDWVTKSLQEAQSIKPQPAWIQADGGRKILIENFQHIIRLMTAMGQQLKQILDRDTIHAEVIPPKPSPRPTSIPAEFGGIKR